MLQELDRFVRDIRSCDGIEAMLLYGSSVATNKDDAWDIDLIVCAKSENFYTPPIVYETVAKHTKNKIKPTIKSIKEFSEKNYVTMTRRYIQHLHNIGQVLYEKEDTALKKKIDNMWNKLKNSVKIDTACKVSPSLIVRHHIFKLYRGIFTIVLNDNGESVARPAKYFWQNAVDVLHLDISPKDEGKIVEKFYEIIPSGSADQISKIQNSIKEVNKKLKGGRTLPELQEEIKKAYFDFKDLVERDMWDLNKYLNKSAPE